MSNKKTTNGVRKYLKSMTKEELIELIMPPEGVEALSWHSGYIEGMDERPPKPKDK